MSRTAKHVFFSGTVQGVGFRFTSQRIARRHALGGYVRNCRDGRVELFLQGPAEDVQECLRDIRETFGRYIRDENIEEAAARPDYDQFEIAF